jgi:hypothetical protein
MTKNMFVLLAVLATAACDEESAAKKGEKQGATDVVPPQAEGEKRGTSSGNDAGSNSTANDAGQSVNNDAGTGDNTARCAELEAQLGPEAAERGVSVAFLCNDPPPGTMEACAEYNQKCK